MLDLIFISKIKPEEKFSKITNEFGIYVTWTIKKRVEKMHSYVDTIAEECPNDKAEEKISKVNDEWEIKYQELEMKYKKLKLEN